MRHKPLICLVDEDENVQRGWLQALGTEADLAYYKDHEDLFKDAAKNPSLIPSFSCIIMGRYFRHLGVDIVASPMPKVIRDSATGPVFLNWQGYITKEEVNARFDGKLFHRYGVKWQTLRIRIQKFDKSHKDSFPNQTFSQKRLDLSPGYTIAPSHYSPESISNDGFSGSKVDNLSLLRDEDQLKPKPTMKIKNRSRPERCSELLKVMATKASGTHKEKIEYYANHDHKTGIQLLEVLYNKLLTDKNRPLTCPSYYINSSPVIAQRILHEALFG